MAESKKKTGFDFHGVADSGIFEDESIILTGSPIDEHEEILSALLPKKPSQIFHFDGDEDTDIKIGIWKAKMIKKLGIEKFFEDSNEQIEIIKELNPTVEVIKVIDGIPQEKMNFICFTFDGSILPIAHKLEKERNRVIVGMIQDKKEIYLDDEEQKPEDPESKEKRLSLYKGITDVYSAKEVLSVMKRIKDKESWFVLTDSNSCFKYTEQALEMGFTHGIFPTAWDRGMEVHRNEAKEFVKEHYPNVKVAEVKTFKTIDEAKSFLSESENFWVLKSLGDAGETIVPDSKEIELARNQIIAALDEMKSEYEQNGFILEQKIHDMIEVTPEMFFIDGVPVSSSIDLENKGIGAGNIGIQTGCVQNLIISTDLESPINKIAFPEKIKEMAKDRKGLFVWDISLLIDKDGVMWYGEFCSNRLGWDSFPTELAMSGDDDMVATPFFAALKHGKNPLRKKFGVGVRLLNIGRGGRSIEEGTIEISDEAEPYTFIYEMKKGKDDSLISTNLGFDLGVVTCAHDELHEAIEECYEYIDGVLFEGKYFRPLFDFTSYEYDSAILKRYYFVTERRLIPFSSEKVGLPV